MAKIIIVEDDPMLGEIYQKKFDESKFEVKLVVDGKMAVEEVENFQPELVLLDIVLPEMDGYEILEQLSQSEKAQNIPVYVFSNLSAKEDIERASSLGAKGFLTKSDYTPTQLVEEVKKLLGKKDKSPAKIAPKTGTEKKSSEKNLSRSKNSNGKKVLIIEDEDVFIEMFGDKLTQEGFGVVSAKNGRWGVREAEKGEFSCILLDMMMPTMNGYEAVQQLRANPKTKNTPIIILSNSALDSEVKKAMELGANAYYIKTQITPAEIVEKVKHLIK